MKYDNVCDCGTTMVWSKAQEKWVCPCTRTQEWRDHNRSRLDEAIARHKKLLKHKAKT